MQIKEPIVISRRLKRHEGTRCTVFGVEKYLGIIPGQTYLISMHMYDEDEYIKPFLKRATAINPERGPQFIIPRDRLIDDDGLYRIAIINVKDENYAHLLREACVDEYMEGYGDEEEEEEDGDGEESDDGSGE